MSRSKNNDGRINNNSSKKASQKQNIKRKNIEEFINKNFSSLLESSSKELTHYITYTSFGILIAIFNTKHIFIKEYKVSVIMSVILAMLGLFTDYFHNQITMWKSLKGLKEDDLSRKEELYNCLTCLSSFLFIINIIILFLLSVCFSYLIYEYFFVWIEDGEQAKLFD